MSKPLSLFNRSWISSSGNSKRDFSENELMSFNNLDAEEGTGPPNPTAEKKTIFSGFWTKAKNISRNSMEAPSKDSSLNQNSENKLGFVPSYFDVSEGSESDIEWRGAHSKSGILKSEKKSSWLLSPNEYLHDDRSFQASPRANVSLQNELMKLSQALMPHPQSEDLVIKQFEMEKLSLESFHDDKMSFPQIDEDTAPTHNKTTSYGQLMIDAREAQRRGMFEDLDYSKVINLGASDSSNPNFYISIAAKRIPKKYVTSFKEMRVLFQYILWKVHALACCPYSIIFLGTGFSHLDSRIFRFMLKSCFALPSPFKTNICQFLILHPSRQTKLFAEFLSPYLDDRLWSKIIFVECIEELTGYLQLPDEVSKSDLIPRYVHCHGRGVSNVFGSPIEISSQQNPSNSGIPVVVEACVSFLKKQPPTSISFVHAGVEQFALEEMAKSFDQGNQVLIFILFKILLI